MSAEVTTKVFQISENGFSMKDDSVSVPACNIKATGFIDAKNKLDKFLSSKLLTEDIELITPMERIAFSSCEE